MAVNAGAGAVAGAVLGFARGGPIGAAIGAVGMFLSGQAAARANVYKTRAAKTRRTMALMQGAVQRREMVRQTRVARAEQLAAAAGAGEYGMLSSGYGGAMGSLMSRAGRNLQVFDAFTRDEVQASFWEAKAGKKSARAADISGLTNLLTVGASFIPQGGLPGGAYWEKNVKGTI